MTWITVKETAKLLNITHQAVRKRVGNGKLEYKYINGIGGNSGRVLQILLESLPQEIQDKYNGIEKKSKLLIEQYSLLQIKEAEYKASIVEAFRKSELSAEKFIKKFNDENSESFSIRQLYSWNKKYIQGKIETLIDTRGGDNKGTSSISEEAWEFFYSLYMTFQRRSIKWCYDKTKLKFPDVPSLRSFERKVKKIPEYAILRYRVGTKAFNDALPHMERSRTGVMSNDIWCSDHHRIDVFVRNSTGHVIRPWLTVFTDIRSTKIMSFIVREADPNATVVKKCLRLGIEKFGVPKEILTDNGKDYKARDLSLEYPLSVMNVLGIGKITATPYHGQAKPVERFFRTLEERFGKMFYSYAGNDAKKRPEHMAKTIKRLEEDPNIPSMDFYVEQLEKWIEEYNNTPHYGEGMDGQTPDNVYIQNLEKRVEVKDRNALKLLCGKTVTRTVDRNGVRIFSQTYSNYDGCLVSYYGKKVMVTYDPDNIDSVFIFDMDYRYICMAESRLKPMFRNTNEEEFNKLAKEKKKVRELVKACRPVREKSIFELIAEHHQQEEMYRNQHEQIETEVLTTPFSEQADKAFEVKTVDRSFEEQMLAYASKENEKEPETHEETGSEEDINFESFMFNYIKNA